MSTAITPQYQQLRELISKEEILKRFEAVLNERAGGFLASVLNAAYQDTNLQKCDPGSVLNAAMTAACLDLPIDKNLGFSAIIPYKSQAQFQVMTKGFVQLALRSGMYEIINYTPIYQGQKVVQDQLTGRITLTGERVSDEPIGYAAYFKLRNGFEKFMYMTIEECLEHAKKYSKAYQYDLREKKASSLWSTNVDAMGLKTVLKLLIKRYGIMSIQMQEAFDRDADNGTNHMGGIEDLDAAVLDAQFEADDEPAPPMPEVQEPELQEQGSQTLAERIVEAGHAQHPKHAASIIAILGLTNDDPDALKKAAGYRGWRDMGADKNQAAAYIKKGEYPK